MSDLEIRMNFTECSTKIFKKKWKTWNRDVEDEVRRSNVCLTGAPEGKGRWTVAEAKDSLEGKTTIHDFKKPDLILMNNIRDLPQSRLIEIKGHPAFYLRYAMFLLRALDISSPFH